MPPSKSEPSHFTKSLFGQFICRWNLWDQCLPPLSAVLAQRHAPSTFADGHTANFDCAGNFRLPAVHSSLHRRPLLTFLRCRQQFKRHPLVNGFVGCRGCYSDCSIARRGRRVLPVAIFASQPSCQPSKGILCICHMVTLAPAAHLTRSLFCLVCAELVARYCRSSVVVSHFVYNLGLVFRASLLPLAS